MQATTKVYQTAPRDLQVDWPHQYNAMRCNTIQRNALQSFAIRNNPRSSAVWTLFILMENFKNSVANVIPKFCVLMVPARANDCSSTESVWRKEVSLLPVL